MTRWVGWLCITSRLFAMASAQARVLRWPRIGRTTRRLLHVPDQVQHEGVDNIGRVSDGELDRWIDAAAVEVDVDVRERLIRNVQRRVAGRHYYQPVHRQTLIGAARRQVHPVVTANNMVRVDWFRID